MPITPSPDSPLPRKRSAADAAADAAESAADLLALLPPTLRALAVRGEHRSFRKGVVLIHEGEQGDNIYVILSGRMRVFSAGDDGREITYGDYGAGEYMGEMSLDGGPRSASVETLQASRCMVITRQVLTQHLAEHPEFAFELLAKVIRRARVATLNARHLALNDVYGRLKLMLDSSALRQPDGSRLIAERMTHKDMARRLGCSREMVSRQMKDLERGGHIVVGDDGGLVIKGELPARW